MEKCTYTLFTINFFLSFLFVSFYMCCDSFCHWKVRFSHWNNKSYMRFYEVRRIPFQLRGHSLCAISYSFFLCSWWDVYGRLTSNLSRCKIFFCVFFSSSLFIISVFRQQYSVALSNSLHLLWLFSFSSRESLSPSVYHCYFLFGFCKHKFIQSTRHKPFIFTILFFISISAHFFQF